MAELVQSIRAKDGTLFDSMERAQRHEAHGDLRELMAKHGVGEGGEWDASMFHSFLVQNAGPIALLLARIGSAPG